MKFELNLCRERFNHCIEHRSIKFINEYNQCDKANDERNVISIAFISKQGIELGKVTLNSGTFIQLLSFYDIVINWTMLIVTGWKVLIERILVFDCHSVIVFVNVTMTSTWKAYAKCKTIDWNLKCLEVKLFNSKSKSQCVFEMYCKRASDLKRWKQLM